MVLGPSAAWLTDNGYLANARVLAPPGFDATGLRKRMGDFDTKQAEQRVITLVGDAVSHYKKHLSGQTAIAFCCSVAHAEAVARLFMSQGIAAASIDGTMDAANRRQLLADLAIGRIRILTSCSLIGEGVDVPSVGGCILLRPTSSVGLHLQMIGRCLRPSGDKTAVVLDHVGNTLRLGHHLEEREWTLDGANKRDREQAPSVKVCPVCFSTSMSATQVCPDCGHGFAPQETRELKVVEGELVEVQPPGNEFKPGDTVRHKSKGTLWILESKVQIKIKRAHAFGEPPNVWYWRVKKEDGHIRSNIDESNLCFVSRPGARKREQGSAQSLEELTALGHQRGYKNPVAWAKHVLAARQSKGQWSKVK